MDPIETLLSDGSSSSKISSGTYVSGLTKFLSVLSLGDTRVAACYSILMSLYFLKRLAGDSSVDTVNPGLFMELFFGTDKF